MTAKLMNFRTIAIYVLLAGAVSAHAQSVTTATWIGPASGGEWNTPQYWDTGAPPLDPTTNAFIGFNTNVNYNFQMTPERFGQLILHGVLNVNAPGFNCSSNLMIRAGGGNRLFINSGGVMDVTGNFIFTSNASVTINPGGVLNVGGELMVGSGITPPGYTGGGTAGASGWMTNNGGTIRASATTINRANSSATSLFVINGGTNDLGAVTVRRSGPAGGVALGGEGLVISNGLVRMTSLDLGGANGNSWLTLFLVDGVVTNTGSFTIRQQTVARGSRFIQMGGVFVATDPTGVIMRGHSASNVIVIYSVTGGTNLVEGFTFGGTGDAFGWAMVTNAAKIYVGSGGFAIGATLGAINIALNPGGVFGAQADWTSTVPMILAGGAFDCANLDGTPRNITLSGVLSGSGALRKFGAGTLTLDAANTYTGDTIIYQGTLALGPSGSIATSPQIIVGPGTTFDVSAVSGGFVHSPGRRLGGFGTVVGDVTVASGAILDPGSNVVAGTLTFTGSLTETGGAINHFDLSTDPSGAANDFVIVQGDLNASGENIIEVIGGGASGSVHKLFRYSGSFNGTLNNFKVVGVEGYLSNNPALKEIYLVVGRAIRGPTNVTWIGGMLANAWDTLVTSNWLNAGVRDVFVPGDNARFDDTGAANPIVNVVGSVAPSWVTVDSTANYAFVGEGTIGGLGGLTKLNTGTLTIRTTNLYTGPTLIMGGAVDVNYVAAGGSPSGLGSSGVDPANLVVSNAAL
ncbi:MAG: autotransporter-associated beta strand repeat-containing protein, partial [Verrucomicrobiales bacterium]|nr:autotransporter-associated beta strand repeat-containing protein [Verrucomicrobiales bacterium]